MGGRQVAEVALGSSPGRTGKPRLVALDLARSLALAGMAVYHFTVDLEMFGVVAAGTTVSGLWFWFARLIAGSFLFLSGVSLYLAHRSGIRWPAFLRRLAMIAAAAALITAATFHAVPDAWIFFGILHSIAVSSVVGLAFLRAPVPVTLLAAAFALVAPHYLRSAAFDAPELAWIGLSTTIPRSIDFEPIFPWLGPFLLGIAAARWTVRAGLVARTTRPAAGGWLRVLAWPGRHSLAIYLIHQPILFGSIWLTFRFLL